MICTICRCFLLVVLFNAPALAEQTHFGNYHDENDIIQDPASVGMYIGQTSACSAASKINVNKDTRKAFLKKYYEYMIDKGFSDVSIKTSMKKGIEEGFQSIEKDKSYAFCLKGASRLQSVYKLMGLDDPQLNKIALTNYY